MTTSASRRAFLRRAGALSLAGTAAPWALNLAAMAEASAATAGDYKALVCVFLYGGNDYANTLVPYDPVNYARYQALRPNLAYGRSALATTALTPAQAPLDRDGMPHAYALAPALGRLAPLFQAGKLGALLNVGTLVQPTTKPQYLSHSVPLPPKLFSHNDQQSVWQAQAPEGARAGWGGRMGDLFEAGNGMAAFTCINMSGNAVYMSGRDAAPYQLAPTGAVALSALSRPLFGSSACSDALRTLITQQRTQMLEDEYTRVTRRAITTNGALTSALASVPALQTPFAAGNPLANQLGMVARLIAAAPSLGVKRQVFFVSLGGFDTHDGLATAHPGLLANLGEALASFYAATQELGVANQVTAFTASDFGRTLTGNNDGSDHGWGSMHFMLGGAVKGGAFYGTAPVVASDGPDDVGQGRLLPTTSVEQYAATLGKWMGIADRDLLPLLPNLANFDRRDLGFMA